MENESFKYPSIEREQAPEETMAVLERALNEGLHVDLVINNPNTDEPMPALDLIVEEIDGENLMMIYLDEDGDVGELIPLSFSRVIKADLREQ